MTDNLKFSRGFDRFAWYGDKIEVDIAGVTYRATLEPDTDSRVEDTDNYSPEHVEAWKRDEWFFVGVVLTAWVDFTELARGPGLWACEMNFPGSDNSNLTEAANDMLADMIEQARAALDKLARLHHQQPADEVDPRQA